MSKDRSTCHDATVTIGGDDREGTHYYVCSECNKPCDLIVTSKPMTTSDPELRETIRKIAGMCEDKNCPERCRYQLDQIMKAISESEATQ